MAKGTNLLKTIFSFRKKLLNQSLTDIKRQKITTKESFSNTANSIFTKDHFKTEPYTIGDYTYGTPEIIDFDGSTKLSIGKFCSIGDNVKILLGGNHRIDWITTYPFNALSFIFPNGSGIKGHPATKGDVNIGNDVWIGHSSIILSGLTIGDGAVIGAGSVVTKEIGPYQIWAGNPAKFIRLRFDEATIKELLNIRWWNFTFEEVNKLAPLLCSNDINKFISYFKQPNA